MERRATAAFKHGASGYTNWDCRCDICSAAHTAKLKKARESRIARMKAGSPDVPHGTSSGYMSWNCRCDACMAASAADRARQPSRIHAPDYHARHYRDHRGEILGRIKAANDESRVRAGRHGYQWTGPDLEVALRGDLTARQAADMLGRTMRAVMNIRFKHKRDVRLQNLAGVRTVER